MTPRKRPPRADEPERTDEHETIEDRRRADRRSSDTSHQQSIARLEDSLSRWYRLLAVALGFGAVLTAIGVWIGLKTQGPGARIDALTSVVEHIQTVQTARDSVLRGSLLTITNQIGQLRFETCLGTAAGRAPGGALACEIQRAQMTLPTARP